MKCLLIGSILVAVGAVTLPAQRGGPPGGEPRVLPPLTAEEMAAIDAALPAVAPAKPMRPRKVLLMNVNVNSTGRRPDVHASLLYGNFAIEGLGKKTGAYATVLSKEVESLSAENLKQYDAIVFNNTTGVLTTDEKLRQSLLSFVRDGKGFVAFHAGGAATFVQYPEYGQFPEFGEMVGGYENGGHPWGPRDTITIRVEDPTNPVNAAFNGEEFTAQDEVYQLADHYSRDKLRVLLSIDTDKSDFENEKRRFWPARKADKDFPMSFIKPYGKGRVFNTIFGHNPAAFSTPALLKHFLAGIQYAIGDLKADDSPGAGK